MAIRQVGQPGSTAMLTDGLPVQGSVGKSSDSVPPSYTLVMHHGQRSALLYEQKMSKLSYTLSTGEQRSEAIEMYAAVYLRSQQANPKGLSGRGVSEGLGQSIDSFTKQTLSTCIIVYPLCNTPMPSNFTEPYCSEVRD